MSCRAYLGSITWKFPVATPANGWFSNIRIETRQRSSRPVPLPTENLVTCWIAWGGAISAK